jgi:hypothetical protein
VVGSGAWWASRERTVVSRGDWAAAKEEVSKKNKRDKLIKGASVKIKVNRASFFFWKTLLFSVT